MNNQNNSWSWLEKFLVQSEFGKGFSFKYLLQFVEKRGKFIATKKPVHLFQFCSMNLANVSCICYICSKDKRVKEHDLF